jgi:hypothetical protein
MSEQRAINRGTGKWGDPTVPRTGWVVGEVFDHGKPCFTCEMCETMTIRYEHQMYHPRYPEMLGTGCICSAHMTGDLASAKQRQREAVNKTNRAKAQAKRDRELAEKLAALQAKTQRGTTSMIDENDDEASFQPEWRQSSSGNWWTKATKGWRITVYTAKNGRWKFMYCLNNDPPLWGKTQHTEAAEAQAMAVKLYDARL